LVLGEKIAGLYKSLSIKNKISLLFILLSLLLLFILGMFASIISSSSVIKKTVENTIQNLNLVSGKFDIVFDNVENNAKIAIRNSDIQTVLFSTVSRQEKASYNEEKQVRKALMNTIEPKTNIDAMFIYDASGNVFNSGNIQVDSENPGLNISENSGEGTAKWILTHKSTYRKLQSYQDIISYLCALVHENSGKPLGTMEVCINERYVSSLYSEIKIGSSGYIFIADKNGTIISDNNKDLLYKSIREEPYYNWVTANEGGRIFKIGSKDCLVINSFYKRLDWLIIGIVPIKEITRDSVLLRFNIFVIGLVCIILAVVMSMLLSSSITKPVIKLKEAMESVGEGNLEVTVDIGSNDEIGVLTQEFNKMVKNTSHLMSRILLEQQKKREYELALLHYQMNPHFLYNTLENICSLADHGRNSDIISVVSELALFYRGVLSKGSNIITLAEEISITERYLKILKLRYGDELEYKFDIDDRIYGVKTLKLLLQPIVENSVYHGIKNKRGKGVICIKGFLDGDRVNIWVKDNGIGIKPELIDRIFEGKESHCQTSSFGLKNTDERIKLYYGNMFGLNIESIYGEGTTVKIVLPVES
jgi:two-component system sensor histidine kinase YesM